MSLRERIGVILVRWGVALLGHPIPPPAPPSVAGLEEEDYDPDAAPAMAVRIPPAARGLVFTGEVQKAPPPEPALPIGGVAERIARSRAKMEMGR